MPPKPHLTHVALFVRTVERSIEFYGRYCGLAIVHDRREESSRVVWIGERVRRPRFVLVLIERTVAIAGEGSFAHFGFSCRSRAEVDERAAMARSEGVLQIEPHDAGPIVGYFCIVRDPDGNSVEFSCGQTIDPGFFRTRAPKTRPPKRRRKRRVKPPPGRRPMRPKRRR